MRDQIIDYIRRNRVSTTEVADCLNKTGVVRNVTALNRGHFCVGRVHWAYAIDESNWTIHEQVRDVSERDIVVMSAINCNDRALIGDLVSKFILLYRQASAIVVIGNVRDTPRLVKENWPIWSEGSSPVGCFNGEPQRSPTPAELRVGDRFADAIAVCDDAGVVVIEKEFHNPAFMKKLEWIEEQEDLWYDCVDRRKWSTFDTVCLRKYEEAK